MFVYIMAALTRPLSNHIFVSVIQNPNKSEIGHHESWLFRGDKCVVVNGDYWLMII